TSPGVLRDEPHGRPALDPIATDHPARAEQVDSGIARVREVVALDEHCDVASYDVAAVRGEVVLAHTDRPAAAVRAAAHGPEAGVLVLQESITDHHRVAVRGREAHPDPVVREAVVLEQDVAGVLRYIHADVAGLHRARLQMVMP